MVPAKPRDGSNFSGKGFQDYPPAKYTFTTEPIAAFPVFRSFKSVAVLLKTFVQKTHPRTSWYLVSNLELIKGNWMIWIYRQQLTQHFRMTQIETCNTYTNSLENENNDARVVHPWFAIQCPVQLPHRILHQIVQMCCKVWVYYHK